MKRMMARRKRAKKRSVHAVHEHFEPVFNDASAASSSSSDIPTTIYSFEPVARADARVLLLGSMPGQRSLQQAQYYAHARNAFWPIMGSLFGAAPELAYPERLHLLQSKRIALWDVLKCCERIGSLDADINAASIVANDFAAFYAAHPTIKQVFFNGAKAAAAYKKYVLPTLPDTCASIGYLRLPSTSPAHAGITLGRKLEQWEVVKRLAHEHA